MQLPNSSMVLTSCSNFRSTILLRQTKTLFTANSAAKVPEMRMDGTMVYRMPRGVIRCSNRVPPNIRQAFLVVSNCRPELALEAVCSSCMQCSSASTWSTSRRFEYRIFCSR